MNRFTAYLLFPTMGFLCVMAESIFHILFGTKWDASIPLFQLLLLRGIFVVLGSLYNNYIIALGKARMMVYMELLRDGAALLALIVTLPVLAQSYTDDLTYGIKIMLIGQVIAYALTFVVMLAVISRLTHRSLGAYLSDCLPYLVETILIMLPMIMLIHYVVNPIVQLILLAITGLGLYVGANYIMKSKIQTEAIDYFMYRFRKKK